MTEAERWREALKGRPGAPAHASGRILAAGDALADALEARDRRIAELEAGLRRIADGEVSPWYAPTIARDLLAGRAAGGEG